VHNLPSLNAMRCFLIAAEKLSFKAASEALFVTQAAVSHQIKLLEDHLDVKLFERLNREVRLTPEGRALLPYVRSAFESLQQGVAQLQDDPNPDRVKVSVIPSFASAWLAPRMGSFRTRHPEYRVVLNPSSKLEDFSGDTDVALRFGHGQYPSVHTELLMRDALLAVCVPEMIPEDGATFDWLKQVDLAEDLSFERHPWNAWLTQQGRQLDGYTVNMTIEDARMLIDITLAGGYVALVRKSLVQPYLVSGKLVKAFDYELPSEYSYYLVAPERYLNRPKVKAFRKWLKHELETSFVPELLDFHGS